MHDEKMGARLSDQTETSDTELASELLPRHLLARVLFFVAAVAASMALATPFLAERPLPLLSIYGGVIAGSLLAIWLVRSGRARWAVATFVAAGFFAITAAVVLLGGVRAPAFFAYIGLVLLTGLVWSERAALVTGLASLAAATVFALVPGAWLPDPLVEVTQWRIWEAFAVELAVVLLALRLASASVRRNLASANTNARVAIEAKRVAERRVRQQTAIARLGSLALASRDVRALLDDFVAEVARTLEADFVKVLELAPDGGSLLLQSGAGWSPGMVGKARVPAGVDSQAGFTLTSKVPVLATDLETERRFGSPELLKSHGVRSGVSVVIASDERPFGILAAHSRTPDFFHDEDALFLHTAANLLSTALGRERLEARLARQDRLEALGRLAGGVAHDFNNLLTVILGYADALVARANRFDPAMAAKEIQGAAERAAALTRDMLTFARQESSAPRTLDLNEIVSQGVRLLQRLVGEDVHVELALTPEPCPIRADPSQIERILVNVVLNARDAQPNGGRIAIETRTGARDGRENVHLLVSDQGTGIASHVLDHVFEPFFTTKPNGKGSGLGLSTVYGLVNQLGGDIHLMSEVGAGTRVDIELPRATEAVAITATAPAPEDGSKGAGETILVAEDDPGLRALIRRALEEGGYVVLEASDGRAAIEAIETHEGAIHALLTDIVMPKADGFEVAARLRTLRPGTRIVYVSGYFGNEGPRAEVEHGDVIYLPKPFRAQDLRAALRSALARQPVDANEKLPG